MRRIDTLRRSRPVAPAIGERSGWVLPDLNQWRLGAPVQTTWGTSPTESIGNNFAGYVEGAYKSNGVVFAVILARLLLFTEARFCYQQMVKGRPGALWGDQSLALLETPWPNGTTGDLLARMEQDASLAGNSYTARRMIVGSWQLRRLRPDWVQIVLGSREGDDDGINAEVLAYLYWPRGIGSGKPEVLRREDVAHYAPIPDPTAQFRGMSWLTPVLEEIRSDSAATRHKGKFFDNAATPNMAIAPKEKMTKAEFVELMGAMDEDHVGVDNAYKNLWLAFGADVTVVGADLKQLDFKLTQGAGETRIAAAGGVPPVIVGLSEGLAQATYSNYGQARRKMGDHWARPSWRSAAGALATLVKPPAGSRLWVDTSDIAFLQEDEMDAAEIFSKKMLTVESGVRAGYQPDSVAAAVEAADLSLLVHTGLFSVQLQPPGSGQPDPSTEE